MKATAAVLRGADQPYAIEEIDLRDLRSHEVLVRIVAAGMCHTDVLPRVPGFIPRMIQLWLDGQFPFDRLIEEFPLSQINEAEQSSLAGGVIKPVLRP